jgi:DNA modification methylase
MKTGAVFDHITGLAFRVYWAFHPNGGLQMRVDASLNYHNARMEQSSKGGMIMKWPENFVDRVIHGDCLKVMKQIPDEAVDLALTDIPYGVVSRSSGGLRKLDKGYADVVTFDLRQFLDEIIRVGKGTFYIFCSREQMSLIYETFVKNSLSTRLCIWNKTNPCPMNGQHIWLSSIETCVFGKKRGATFNEHCKSPVWRFPSGRSKRHPTEKPLGLFQYLVEVSSNESDVVLDPCLGSGTTAIACMRTNRRYIGIEVNENYYRLAEQRIARILQER